MRKLEDLETSLRILKDGPSEFLKSVEGQKLAKSLVEQTVLQKAVLPSEDLSNNFSMDDSAPSTVFHYARGLARSTFKDVLPKEDQIKHKEAIAKVHERMKKHGTRDWTHETRGGTDKGKDGHFDENYVAKAYKRHTKGKATQDDHKDLAITHAALANIDDEGQAGNIERLKEHLSKIK